MLRQESIITSSITSPQGQARVRNGNDNSPRLTSLCELYLWLLISFIYPRLPSIHSTSNTSHYYMLLVYLILALIFQVFDLLVNAIYNHLNSRLLWTTISKMSAYTVWWSSLAWLLFIGSHVRIPLHLLPYGQLDNVFSPHTIKMCLTTKYMDICFVDWLYFQFKVTG